MTDSLIFFLKTEASPLCREVTVSYSITETVQVAVSFPLDDVMPWFPGHPKSVGWNLNSFGLSPQMAGKWMNLYFLLWWRCSTVPVLPYVTWIETAVWYLVIPLVDCAVHCLPHPGVIPNGMSCASKIWSCASSLLLFASPLAVLPSSAGLCWQPGWDSVQSQTHLGIHK